MTKFALPTMQYESELVSKLFELERLRAQLGLGTTPDAVYDELHRLFQLLMSVVSARIEGNRTTVYEAASDLGVDSETPTPSDRLREIENIRRAMAYIDGLPDGQELTHLLLRQLHEMAVEGLVREGDPTPGSYRNVDVSILRAEHRPPSHVVLRPELDDLIDFVNQPTIPRSQLVHVAVAHHRFLWIHPFRNGNGRVSRLLSYFMLRKHRFVSPVGMRTVNPAAVFGSNRGEYLDALAMADDLSNEGTLKWTEFFVRGMVTDLGRLVQLQDFEIVQSRLIKPAIDRFHLAGGVSPAERDALKRVIELETVKARDLEPFFPGSPSTRSQQIRSLIDRGLLVPIAPGARRYRLSFTTRGLVTYVVRQLDEMGYLPTLLQDDPQT